MNELTVDEVAGRFELRGIGRVEKRGGGMGIFDEYVDSLEGPLRGQVCVADYMLQIFQFMLPGR
ncbi:MAG: hypothetical protein ACYSTJ_00370 [Planctomycetota bacterium]